MATPRDPTKLEPAYLITLAVIVGLPICCSFMNRSVPPPSPPKISVPQTGTWTVKMKDGAGPTATSRIAVSDGKWRVETRYPDDTDTLVVVRDGQRSVANSPMFQPEQLAKLDPLKLLQAVAFAYNQHPAPESQSVDGVLCWHANVRERDNEVETWLEASTGFPKRFQSRRGNGRAISYDFENFSRQVPDDPRIFNAEVLEPVLPP